MAITMFPLIDCHNHSNNSFDATDTVEDSCLRAEELGLFAFALTDHSDLDGSNLSECIHTINRSVEQTEHFRSTHHTSCKILTGLELGEAVDFPKDAQTMTTLRPYDVIIGSYHNSPSGEDYYYLNVKKKTDAEIRASLQWYFEKLIQTVQTTDLDVLAHITYPLRYIVGEQKRQVDLAHYQKEITLLFRSIIEKDISLEVNSSGLRQKIGEPLPSKALLKTYRQMGGTMISLGSDSHNTADVAKGIPECTELLSELGFSHVTYFCKRQPIQISIR